MRQFRAFPWLAINPPGEPKKRKLKPGHRTDKHRRISQDAIRQMRAEYLTLPRTALGRPVMGSVKAFCERWHISPTYFRMINSYGLRDDEREVA